MPTVWDETRVLNGKIGEYATIARRSSDDWFLGTINNRQPRQLSVPLSFLTPGKEYVAHIYADDKDALTRTKVGITTRQVNSQATLEVPLISAGGQAVHIVPATDRGQ